MARDIDVLGNILVFFMMLDSGNCSTLDYEACFRDTEIGEA